MTLTHKEDKPTSREVRKYTKEDKERYALAWILHGEISRASASCGIPRKTCEYWMRKAWWPRLVEVVRIRHKDEIEAKYEHILTKSTDALLDRIESGDTVIVKGKEKKVPVKAKELAGIVDVVQSNLRTSRNQPNTISVSATMNLTTLASEFARAGRRYQYTLHGKYDPMKDNEEDPKALPPDESDIIDAEFTEDELELDDDEDGTENS